MTYLLIIIGNISITYFLLAVNRKQLKFSHTRWNLSCKGLFCYHNIAVDLLPAVDGINLAGGVVLCYIAAELLGFFLGRVKPREKEKEGVTVEAEGIYKSE